jgi:ubiquinone/menaquinone biosynthesis C-methylase UbiE
MTLPGFFEGTGMPAPGWWEALWPDPAKVLELVGLKTGMDVIDLCSGDGWFTLKVAQVARHVTSVDIDANLLDMARIRLADSGAANCDFITGDAYDLAALVPTKADFIFLANAFHGVPDRTRLARSVRDTLVPGGQFAIVNWHARPREETTILGEPRGPATELRMTPRQTIEPVEAAGLKLLRVVELPLYHYGAVFQKSTP